jgi:hypothetical protein
MPRPGVEAHYNFQTIRRTFREHSECRARHSCDFLQMPPVRENSVSRGRIGLVRKRLYAFAAAIVLSPAMAKAQQTADCLQDEPGVASHGWVPELDITAAAGTTGSLDFSNRLSEVGDAALEHGDLATAEKYHRRALAIAEKLVPRSLSVADTLNALGSGASWRRRKNTSSAR